MEGDCMYEEFTQNRIAQLRNQRDVSARDMSLSIGQCENYINQIENKKTLPSLTGFFYICEYFGVTPKDFFDEDNTNPALLNELMCKAKRLDASCCALLIQLVDHLLAEHKTVK